MCPMTQSIMGHSGSPSGSVWWIQDRAVTISFVPLPVIGWSGMHHSGCRHTPITSFWPLPCRMRPEIHDGGQSFCTLCAQHPRTPVNKPEVWFLTNLAHSPGYLLASTENFEDHPA
jgi:hypothetical protein